MEYNRLGNLYKLRVVEEFSHNGINEKRVNFQFVQFREYIR